MKVKLTEIKAATPRVRKELNLDKMDELADSIKETGGVIVPVKLRKNGEGYTTVYGHRRIEACRMAGLTDVDAFIEDMDDAVLLTQALIENVVREDMASIDIGKAFRQIKLENEWTDDEVGARFGMTGKSVNDYLQMLRPELKSAVEKSDRSENIGVLHIKSARAGTDDDADAAKVIEKSAKEGLSARQTRTVAEEYKRAKDYGGARAGKQVLDTPFSELGLRQFVPTTRPDSRSRTPVEIVQKKVVFSWVRDINIVRAGEMLSGMAATISNLSAVVEYMKVNFDKEPKQLKIVQKNMVAHIEKRMGELDALLTKTKEIYND